jgi:hypothetical protein
MDQRKDVIVFLSVLFSAMGDAPTLGHRSQNAHFGAADHIVSVVLLAPQLGVFSLLL